MTYSLFRYSRTEQRDSVPSMALLDLEEIGAALCEGGAVGPLHEETAFFDLPGMEDERHRLGRELGEKLARCFQYSLVVVVELRTQAFAERQGAEEATLATAWSSAKEHITADHKILLLVDSIPPETDELRQHLAPDIEGGQIRIVAANGETVDSANSFAISAEILEGSKIGPEQYQGLLGRRIVRRRGVFEIIGTDQLVGYQYEGSNCGAPLRAAIQLYLDEITAQTGGKGVLVYDSSRSDWTREYALGAAKRTSNVNAYGSDAFTDPNYDFADECREKLAEAKFVVLFSSLIRSGRSLDHLFRIVNESTDIGEFHFLSVMLDPGHRTLASSNPPGMKSVFLSIGGRNERVDFFQEVEQPTLPADNWLGMAAKSTGAIEPLHEKMYPSAIGLWALFDEVGISREEPVPSGRAAIKLMPRLSNVSDWDAHWLASELVRLAIEDVGAHKDDVLLALPEEASGSRAIAVAAQTRLEISVLPIPRKVIDGEEVLNEELIRRLQRYSSRRVILADESTITYGTFESMEAILASFIGRPSDASVVCLDLGDPLNPARPENLRSLYAWDAGASVEGPAA